MLKMIPNCFDALGSLGDWVIDSNVRMSESTAPEMYQISHPPHPPRMYLQTLHQMQSTDGRDPDSTVLRYLTTDQTAYKNGQLLKKSAPRHPRRTSKPPLPPTHQAASPPVSECESDDSGLSSTTSSSINNATLDINENITKKLTGNTHNRIHTNGQNPHFGHLIQSNPRFSLHQQSLLFHNKRRYPANRPPSSGRNLPAVRCHFPALQHFTVPHSIAPDRFLMKAHQMHVKNAPAHLLNGSKWDSLSQDIWKKFMELQQTEEIFKRKMELWRFLYLSIKSVFPRYSLYLVGSTITGFGSLTSDMDLCLLVKHPEVGDSRMHALQHLTTIYHFIYSKDMLFHSELIQAKVPILKFCDNRFFLEVDLNCNNVVGIRNTHLLYCYSQLDWRVKPLVVIVKLWAQFHNINDAKNRTISSYSYVLMVIHYLQCGTSPSILPCLQKEFPDKFSPNMSIFNIDLLEEMPKYKSKNDQTLGELFRGFLQYYNSFEYSQYAISVRTGNLLSIDECRAAHRNEPHQWKLLCVEEPFDLSNTARSVYDPEVFNQIRGVFAKSMQLLETSLKLSSILPD